MPLKAIKPASDRLVSERTQILKLAQREETGLVNVVPGVCPTRLVREVLRSNTSHFLLEFFILLTKHFPTFHHVGKKKGRTFFK